MKILVTNADFAERAGTQLYTRDLALELRRRGHSPFVYSPVLGEAAEALRSATIPVVDDLASLSTAPDLIHGQHHLETLTALLHFPGVPAVYFCHGWLPWEEAPPRFPRIFRYVAVDHTVRDRLVFEHGIPEDKIRVILNFVDLQRFVRRGPLPPKPVRALVLSNYARENDGLVAVREACARAGIRVEVAGAGVGRPSAEPEKLLSGYDLVFAKARSAMEAMAVGAAVVLCDRGKAGPMVTSGEFERLRRANFGIRELVDPISVDALLREIRRYDAADAAKVSALVRSSSGLEAAVTEIEDLYRETLEEAGRSAPAGPAAEFRAAAAYLKGLSLRVRDYEHTRAHLAAARRGALERIKSFLSRSR